MSKLFFDHLIDLTGLEKEIKKLTSSEEEKQELWLIVDDIVHHKVIGLILAKLPREHHDEFLNFFHAAPYDDNLIAYLKEKVNGNIEELISQEIGSLTYKILQDLKNKEP